MNIYLNISQNELVNAVKAGDDDACAELLRRYAPLVNSIVRAAMLMLPNASRPDGDELRQEATIKLYQAALSYNPESGAASFGLYAKICIKNRMISLIRKRHGEPGVTDTPGEEYDDNYNDYDTRLITDAEYGDPSTAILARESEDELLGRIKHSLSPLEYKVFLMYKDGKKSSDIAECLKIKIKTVENAIYRMKIKITKLL